MHACIRAKFIPHTKSYRNIHTGPFTPGSTVAEVIRYQILLFRAYIYIYECMYACTCMYRPTSKADLKSSSGCGTNTTLPSQ